MQRAFSSLVVVSSLAKVSSAVSKPLIRRALKYAWVRLKNPVCHETDIASALLRLDLKPAKILMVHSSLSSCGHIRGGAFLVIKALRQWANHGTLVMPTHTYCYPDNTGAAPVFDAKVTPSVVGNITDVFWRQSGVHRSVHPTHSLAACGPEAEALCTGHENCDTPCGKGTPYERLVQGNCAALMFGVTMNAYTFFHTAEDAAELPFLYESVPYSLKYRDNGGTVRELKMWRHDMSVPRAFRTMDTWFEAHGLLKRARLGLGELLFVPDVKAAHIAVVEALKKNPTLLVDDRAKKQCGASNQTK